MDYQQRKTEPPNQLIWVQFWCNRDGKGGFCGLNGQLGVDSIERVDTVFPQIQDGQSSRTIRSQTLYPLNYGCVWMYYPAEWGTVKFLDKRAAFIMWSVCNNISLTNKDISILEVVLGLSLNYILTITSFRLMSTRERDERLDYVRYTGSNLWRTRNSRRGTTPIPS